MGNQDKFRKGRAYTINPINAIDILEKHPMIMEEFIADIKLYTRRKIKTKKQSFQYTNISKNIQKINNIHFGFDKITEDDSTYIGEQNKESLHIGDGGFPHNGDYLFFVSFYLFIKKLFVFGATDIKLVCLLGGENSNIIANNEEDIAVFFDITFAPELIENEYNDEKFMGIWGIKHMPWSKKASDLIPYLQKPYNIAYRMEGFPKEWLM